MGWVNIIDVRGDEGDLPAIIHGKVGGYPLEALRYKPGVGILKFWRPQKRGHVRAEYLAHRAAVDNWVQAWVHEVED